MDGESWSHTTLSKPTEGEKTSSVNEVLCLFTSTSTKLPLPNPAAHITLQGNHTGTDAHGDNHVQTDSVIADGEETSQRSTGNSKVALVIARSTGGASVGRSSGSGGLLVDAAGRGQGSRALRLRLGRDNLGLALEVARGGSLVALGVESIENVVKLVAIGAHAVGTIDTSGGVSDDTSADFRSLAADVTEHLTIVLLIEILGPDA